MYQIELHPNCSLTPRAAVLFYSSIAAISISVAGGFAYLGLWPVLPFAGLELLAVGLALGASMRRGQYREVIRVDQEQVQISKSGVSANQNVAFPRYWTKVRMQRPPHNGHPSRLLIGSRGKFCEVGAFLTEEERHGLGRRLSHLVECLEDRGPFRGKETGTGVNE